jgi:hypothetical protein
MSQAKKTTVSTKVERVSVKKGMTSGSRGLESNYAKPSSVGRFVSTAAEAQGIRQKLAAHPMREEALFKKAADDMKFKEESNRRYATRAAAVRPLKKK